MRGGLQALEGALLHPNLEGAHMDTITNTKNEDGLDIPAFLRRLPTVCGRLFDAPAGTRRRFFNANWKDGNRAQVRARANTAW